MSTRKIIKFRFIINFIILIILIMVSNYINFNVVNNVSDIIEYKNVSGVNGGIGFDELSKVKDRYKDIKFTGAKEIKTNITNKYGSSPAKEIKTKIVLTDENYFDLYPFKVVRGGKIDFLSIEKGSKVAVISDVLANSLFKSVDVIGSTLNVKNEKYKIVGVYKENTSVLYSAAEDGYERIYIPYTSYSNDNTKDKYFLDIMATPKTKNYDEKNIDDKLSKILNDKLALYKSVDYTVSKNIVMQTVRILYFLIGIFVIIFLIKLIVKFIREVKSFFKGNIRYSYLNEVIINNKKELLVFIGKVLICVVGIIIVFNVIKFKLVIENSFLPSNNIFDINFYRKAIISNIQLNNANESGIANVYNRYITIAGNAQKILFVGEVFALIGLILNKKVLIKLKNKM